MERRGFLSDGLSKSDFSCEKWPFCGYFAEFSVDPAGKNAIIKE